jgi:hypothetical protein
VSYTARMRNWAEEILALSLAERRATTAFSPFVPDPESGRLHLVNEMIRRERRDGLGFPVAPSPGWVELAPGMMIWCPLGAEDVLSGRQLPHRVVSPVSGTININPQVILELVSSGSGFVFCGDLFLLPKEQYTMNSFTYEAEPEPLDIFVGYRGHTKRYDEILTPSIYRKYNNPSRESFVAYSRRAIYAGNVIKQAFWENETVALDNVRALGVLQHHGTIGRTDILDLSYEMNVAKWFALNEWDSERQRYKQKPFKHHSDDDEMLDEASYVYAVVVRALGGTSDPLPIQIHGQDVHLLPWNLNPLWSTRPQAQRGFGVWGLGLEDFDKFGAVLSVIEARYHPYGAETGWDHLGGPHLTLNGKTYHALDDSSSVQESLFPLEEPCLARAFAMAKEGIAKHNLVT